MKPFPLLSSFFLLIFAFCLLPSALGQESQRIKVTHNSRGITSITSPQDSAHVNLLSGTLGNPVVRYRIGSGDWLDLYRDETRLKAQGSGLREGRGQKAEGRNQDEELRDKDQGSTSVNPALRPGVRASLPVKTPESPTKITSPVCP